MLKAGFRIGSIKLKVYIPETLQEHIDGLQPFEKLDSGYGMLFHYEPPKAVNFHMASVKFPIDIAFFDDCGNLAKIVRNAKPGSKEIWGLSNCNAVLEVPGGYFDRSGISEGIYDYDIDPCEDFDYNPFSLSDCDNQIEADALTDSLHGATPDVLFEHIHRDFSRITPLRIESPKGDWSHMDVGNIHNPKDVEWYSRTSQENPNNIDVASVITSIVKLINDIGAPEWTLTEEVKGDNTQYRQRFAKINKHDIRLYATRSKDIDASNLDWIDVFWSNKQNLIDLSDALLVAGLADGYKIEGDEIILYEYFQ